MKERIIPVAGFLVVRRDPAPEQVRGLIMPDVVAGQTIMTTGTVIAIGASVSQALNADPHFKVGCKITFEIFTGNSYTDEFRTEKIVILKAEDVRGIVVED